MTGHTQPAFNDAMANPARFNREVHIIHIGDALAQLVAKDLLPEHLATRIYKKHWHQTKPLYQPRQMPRITTG